MSNHIHWQDDGTGGYVGTASRRIFIIWPPEEDGSEWTLTAALPGYEGKVSYRDTPEELHPDAERWLEEFVSSLGAIFPEPATDRSSWPSADELAEMSMHDQLMREQRCAEAEAESSEEKSPGQASCEAFWTYMGTGPDGQPWLRKADLAW